MLYNKKDIMESYTITERIIHSLKYFFIIGFALLIIGTVIIIVYQTSSQKTSDASITLLEQTYEDYNTILNDFTNDDASLDNKETLIKNLQEITKKYPKSFAAQKAYMRIGTILSFSKNSYQEALQNFLHATKINTKSYLIPLAYFQAGVIAEKLNNTEEAKKYYQIVTDNTTVNIVKAHALFSLGRIVEQTAKTAQEKKNALGYYQTIIDSDLWGNSNWASLAKPAFYILNMINKLFATTTLKYLLCGLLIVIIFNGCGLSNITSLNSASIERVEEGVIRINHNTSNINNFLGYNIYYKFYNSADASLLQSDKNYITDSTKQPSSSILTTRKFKLIQIVTINPNTLVVTNTNTVPHITPLRESLDQPYVVYIDFSEGKAVYPLRETISNSIFSQPNGNEFHVILIKANENNQTSIIRRDHSVNTTPKGFFNSKTMSSYSKKDFDIKTMMKNFKSDDTIQIIFAILPYGIDYVQGQKIYGEISISPEMTIQYKNTP